MVEPNGVLDDGYRETVAVRLGVGHGASAYPNPIKATQPARQLFGFAPVSAAQLSWCTVAALVSVGWIEIYKLVLARRQRAA